jgi:hypothetical protein
MKQSFHLIEQYAGRTLSCRLLVKADTMEAAVKKLRSITRQSKRLAKPVTYRPATQQETVDVVGQIDVGGKTVSERLKEKLASLRSVRK